MGLGDGKGVGALLGKGVGPGLGNGVGNLLGKGVGALLGSGVGALLGCGVGGKVSETTTVNVTTNAWPNLSPFLGVAVTVY